MNYVLSIICGIFAMSCILLTSSERGNENFFFKEGGKERLSEREDFKNFPQAGDICIDLDLSKKEVWDISYNEEHSNLSRF